MMEKEIRVWDPLVRIFHWSLVLGFTIGYLSGDEESDLHIYAGYVVLGLISFRLIWGFIGSPYARFKDFVRSPSTIIAYLKELIAGRAKHYIGHNPAAGAMILALLLGLFVVSYSGLKVYAIEEGAGPLAQQTTETSLISSAYANDDDDEHEGKNEEEGDEDFWEEVHEVSADFVVFLVVLHIAGVLLSSKLHKENLVRAMITGKKKVK
jgi:cytochrome b